MNEKTTEAHYGTVTTVCEGKHGPYAVVKINNDQFATFSLRKEDGVWQEIDLPDLGISVVLNDLRKKRAGWRAYKARFLRPEDDQGR